MEAVKYIHNVIKLLDDYPVYYVEADTAQAAPYIVVNLINEQPIATKAASDEPAMSRVQLSVFGNTVMEVDTITRYLVELLDNTFPASGGIHQVDYRDKSSPLRISDLNRVYFSALEFDVLHDVRTAGLVTTLVTIRDWDGTVQGQMITTTLNE